LAEARALLDQLIEAARSPELDEQRAQALAVAAGLPRHTDYARSVELAEESIRAAGPGRRPGARNALTMISWGTWPASPNRLAMLRGRPRSVAVDDAALLLVALQGLSLTLLRLGENDERERWLLRPSLSEIGQVIATPSL
jgi:hypothetical protein